MIIKLHVSQGNGGKKKQGAPIYVNTDDVYNPEMHGKSCTSFPPPCPCCWVLTQNNFGEIYVLENQQAAAMAAMLNSQKFSNITTDYRWKVRLDKCHVYVHC